MIGRQALPADGPHRYWPEAGQMLTHANIQGQWQPSASVDCAGVVAVVWYPPQGVQWAPLHDFDSQTQLDLIAACERLDRDRGFAGAHPGGRSQ